MSGRPAIGSTSLNRSRTGALNNTNNMMLRIASFCLCLFFIFISILEKDTPLFKRRSSSSTTFFLNLIVGILTFKRIPSEDSQTSYDNRYQDHKDDPSEHIVFLLVRHYFWDAEYRQAVISHYKCEQ